MAGRLRRRSRSLPAKSTANAAIARRTAQDAPGKEAAPKPPPRTEGAPLPLKQGAPAIPKAAAPPPLPKAVAECEKGEKPAGPASPLSAVQSAGEHGREKAASPVVAKEASSAEKREERKSAAPPPLPAKKEATSKKASPPPPPLPTQSKAEKPSATAKGAPARAPLGQAFLGEEAFESFEQRPKPGEQNWDELAASRSKEASGLGQEYARMYGEAVGAEESPKPSFPPPVPKPPPPPRPAPPRAPSAPEVLPQYASLLLGHTQDKEEEKDGLDSEQIAVGESTAHPEKARPGKRRLWAGALVGALALVLAGAYALGLFSPGGLGSSEAAAALSPQLPRPPQGPSPEEVRALLAQAEVHARSGQWEEAAALAEKAGEDALARKYRTEAKLFATLQKCREARNQGDLDEAMQLCQTLAEAKESQVALDAAEEIDALKKDFARIHIAAAKKALSRRDKASLAAAEEEISLLSRYLGEDDPDVLALQKRYDALPKKDANTVAELTPKTPSPAAPASPTPTPTPKEEPTPTDESPNGLYLVKGVYLTLGSFGSKAKGKAASGLPGKLRSLLSRHISASGKASQSLPKGKRPITLSGTILKADVKEAGGTTRITVGISIQVTRDAAILAFISKEGTAEFSGAISSSEEKSGRDELMRTLVDAAYADLSKNLYKWK